MAFAVKGAQNVDGMKKTQSLKCGDIGFVTDRYTFFFKPLVFDLACSSKMVLRAAYLSIVNRISGRSLMRRLIFLWPSCMPKSKLLSSAVVFGICQEVDYRVLQSKQAQNVVGKKKGQKRWHIVHILQAIGFRFRVSPILTFCGTSGLTNRTSPRSSSFFIPQPTYTHYNSCSRINTTVNLDRK